MEVLYEFILCMPHDHPIRLQYLSHWMLFLSRRNMKALKLEITREIHMKFHPLFLCKDLIFSELTNFTLRSPPDFVGFNSLVQLYMCHLRIESPTLENLISSCPLLENPTISYRYDHGYPNISSPILEVLIIEGSQLSKSICFEESASLMDLKIAFEISGENFERGKTSNLIDICSPLPEIEKLRFGGGYIQYLSGGSIPGKLPNMVSYLTHLQMSEIAFSEPRKISLLLCFLKNFPNLEELEVMIWDRQPIWSLFQSSLAMAALFLRFRK